MLQSSIYSPGVLLLPMACNPFRNLFKGVPFIFPLALSLRETPLPLPHSFFSGLELPLRRQRPARSRLWCHMSIIPMRKAAGLQATRWYCSQDGGSWASTWGPGASLFFANANAAFLSKGIFL